LAADLQVVFPCLISTNQPSDDFAHTGLAAAIAFQQHVPEAEFTIFEQAAVLREIGAVGFPSPSREGNCSSHDHQGISINENTWRMLDKLNAKEALKSYYMFAAFPWHSVMLNRALQHPGKSTIPTQVR
jgi:2-polyprenyl-6-methoxyphenol hydroxylase-like FAD-dependent oxidoreductase